MLSFISIIPTGAYIVGRKEKVLNHEKKLKLSLEANTMCLKFNSRE